MKTIIIKTIKELIEHIHTINCNNEYWFRGQSNSEYILNPSSRRQLYIVGDQFGRPVNPRKLDSFNRRGDKVLLMGKTYLEAFFNELDRYQISYNPDMNTIEKLCLAQHYGVWTPLMDWTTDFTVALFFCLDTRKDNSDCAVFLLDPVKWNDMACGMPKILNTEEVFAICDLLPLAMQGPRFDKRMCRQSGNFTVHGHLVWPLEQYPNTDDILIKIIIPSKVAKLLTSYMHSFGITHESIYVGKDEKDDVSERIKELNTAKLNEELERCRLIWENTPDYDRGIEKHVEIW